MKSWEFWIDVGGTFTDCVARDPSGQITQHKTLSSGVTKGRTSSDAGLARRGQIVDPARSRDPDRIWKGYRIGFGVNPEQTHFVIGFENGILSLGDISVPVDSHYELISPEPAPLVAIRYLLGLSLDSSLPPISLRLGTTRGTNALLTRTGSRTALVTTEGFRDILRIGYQTRPDLFALDIQLSTPLYETVVEVRERVTADGKIQTELNIADVREALAALRTAGIESLAVALMHACVEPKHELALLDLAKEMGFRNVSVSHQVSSLRKLVPRGDTTVLDAFLNPVLEEYLGSIAKVLHPDSTFDLMTSSGGLRPEKTFRGRDSILSGPAGGVVGVAHVARGLGCRSAIGFDMGGTSTDVSRWCDSNTEAAEFDLEFETEKAGQRIASPMMAIETVAAGGGSVCHFDGIKFAVGPQSAGASPGPACYGRGGPLSVTDVNLWLGRISEHAFPFPLDRDAVARELQQHSETIAATTDKRLTPTEVAQGYLRVANTNMAEAIRSVSVQRGIDPRHELLVAFGGAAAQHACAVARDLGARRIAIHPSAGILSALGIGMASLTVHREKGVYEDLDSFLTSNHEATIAQLTIEAEREVETGAVRSQDRTKDSLHIQRYLDLRFYGLDSSIRIAEPEDGNYREAYLREFQRRSGYLPAEQAIECVTARILATCDVRKPPEISRVPETRRHPQSETTQSATFAGKHFTVPVFDRDRLVPGDHIAGPAIICEAISTIVVEPDWQASVATAGEILLSELQPMPSVKPTDPTAAATVRSATEADPVLLEVFNNRFAAIATQMGITLRKTSRSVNVKERLDYSCAIFTANGDLVVNAPHVPVHLGAMGATVRHILQTLPLEPNDVIVTNDPYHGGSHLPDVTVVTPVHDSKGTLRFFTASRAHHAEIGGISPGSMPAFSTNLADEGKLIRATKVIAGGESRIAEVESLLSAPPYPSRNPSLNIADLQAQIAANRWGLENLQKFVHDYTWPIVAAYMEFIQAGAEQKARQALRRVSGGGTIERQFTDHLDDGSSIHLALTIDDDRARFDFSGTAGPSPFNLNANPAIVTAATMYCLRLLIDEDLPLNDGVLRPVELIIPTGLLHPAAHEDPALCPGIVGGNVETSQRLVDVILGAFELAAASQGTMNNLLFGDESFGYYETICGGAGATANAPGASAVHTHMTNTRLTDPEILEHRFPVLLRRFQIRTGSGGTGKYSGGDGVIREVEFLRTLDLSLLTQRRGDYAPYGLAGGQPGQCGRNLLRRANGAQEELASLASCQVFAGDLLRIETPGGGGWGDHRQAMQSTD